MIPKQFPGENRFNLKKLEKKWQLIANAYRKENPGLSEEDISYRDGEFDLMTDKTTKKTNKDRETVWKEIQEWKLNEGFV